jgi:3-phenylpropionate/trans-cinnamate dioxygenase ferredoxin reductase subunit
MPQRYVIVGGGIAGAHAIEGIRSVDREGPITLLSRENHAPYNRPYLSKDLWFGKTTLEKLPEYDDAFYREQNVELALRREVVELNPEARKVWDDRGAEIPYDRLLLATGGRPVRLNVPGAELEAIHYFRDLEDYFFLRGRVEQIDHVFVVGGGFIGLELAAAMKHAGREVTLLYSGPTPLARILPRDLGTFVADYYREKGVETVSDDLVVGFEDRGGTVMARTASGGMVETQLVLAGVGIEPQLDLAEAAGLEINDGVVVDEYVRTSDSAIWAAGDIAEYPEVALGRTRRVEHVDQARRQGRCAGVNMAGGREAYDGLPLFYSDFFDLGWEAVGELDATLETEALWKEPFREGVVLYMSEGVTRGVLLWNVWEKVDAARRLIRAGRPMGREERIAMLEV